MLHGKLHVCLNILHSDISSGKAIFSLENVKNLVWRLQYILVKWEMLLNLSLDKCSSEFVGGFPTVSNKHAEGTCCYREAQSEHDNLGEERVQND